MPELKNASEVLNHLEKPENAAALKAYMDAKRPAEELLAKQRKALDAYFGPRR